LSHAYSDDDGKFLVSIARNTVDEYVHHKNKLQSPEDTPNHLKAESGVFVTLNTLRDDIASLRGCIGRPYPTQPLIEATIDSAVDAAVHDPRFPPVSPKELDSIIVEMSVLTPPKKLEYANPSELINLVKVGRDGLIVSRGMWRGLLLPQVPVEWEWDVKKFIQHTCNKAGLPGDAWKEPDTEFMAFQAEIFGELEPHGGIVRNPKHSRC
jgi:uncharacterized protein (TIGR00296 family)